MNYFKEAESILSSYPSLLRALENIQKRKERIVARGAPTELASIDFSKPYIDGNCFNDTYGQMLDLIKINKEEDDTKALLEDIETALLHIRDDNRRIILLWYFDKKSKEEIAEIMGVESTTTVYSHRNAAVGEFALLYFGAAALASI